ncbi:MAG TPA: M28 family metallopeptidase [Acidobacteriaceae bacterium]|nr:M28 family metallopeptidase [Acidobacteriaceae bacterium]
MPNRTGAFLLLSGLFVFQAKLAAQQPAPTPSPATFVGFSDSAKQAALDQQFLQVPDAALAGQELKVLTAVPHIAGSKEDYATAKYVAQKFRAAGLQTKIVPYRVMMNLPKTIEVTAYDATGKQIMSGPTPEHVSDDPYQDDKRIVTPFNGSSASGDVTADVVYANYGRPKDFAELDARDIDVRGKIVIVRYGKNFRGVKAYIAQQRGAAGVIIYSDPADDGYFLGDKYPVGPYRPATGVQRGSVQYLFEYPGDPTTPGFASVPGLPASKRISMQDATNQPKIPSTPLSYQDAAPILKALGGPQSPRGWQGALPFTYHIGPGPVKVHLLLQQDYALRTIWDVEGTIPGTEFPDDWVVVGNHRDAWVFGAVDPGSGTAALLEAVHGVGALLKQGWKPRRTIIFSSWDAEEEGLIGSTEWAEQHAAQLQHAVAYFNVDVAVSGPNFEAEAVPSLKPFLVDITKLVPSPQGGTVDSAWQAQQQQDTADKNNGHAKKNPPNLPLVQGIRLGNLGSGSDYTPFLQHLGVPSTDIGSTGRYGVYHSTFDDYTWYTKFADPTFVYLKQQASVLGLEALHMADADVLPYDYSLYGQEVVDYLQAAQQKAAKLDMHALNFGPALEAARAFQDAGAHVASAEQNPAGPPQQLNDSLRLVETDLLSQKGLPARGWYKHTVYAPGEYTGYAAVVIPGINEALDAHDASRAAQQLDVLTRALHRATATLRQLP